MHIVTMDDKILMCIYNFQNMITYPKWNSQIKINNSLTSSNYKAYFYNKK